MRMHLSKILVIESFVNQIQRSGATKTEARQRVKESNLRNGIRSEKKYKDKQCKRNRNRIQNNRSVRYQVTCSGFALLV